MKINAKIQPQKNLLLKDLADGDLFYTKLVGHHNGKEIYMKLAQPNNYQNCIRLCDGHFGWVSQNDFVVPVNHEFNVEL